MDKSSLKNIDEMILYKYIPLLINIIFIIEIFIVSRKQGDNFFDAFINASCFIAISIIEFFSNKAKKNARKKTP